MQRVRRPAGHIDCPAGRDQRLSYDLAAEHALPAHLRRTAAKKVHLQLFEIEGRQEILHGGRHESCSS